MASTKTRWIFNIAIAFVFVGNVSCRIPYSKWYIYIYIPRLQRVRAFLIIYSVVSNKRVTRIIIKTRNAFSDRYSDASSHLELLNNHKIACLFILWTFLFSLRLNLIYYRCWFNTLGKVYRFEYCNTVRHTRLYVPHKCWKTTNKPDRNDETDFH